MTTRYPHRTPSLILKFLLLGVALAVPLAASSQAAAPAAEVRRSVTVAAGPLDRALNQYASDAGIELSVDARLLQGCSSAGLSGSYTLSEGFAELLRGDGLQAVRQANGSYIISKAAPAPLPIPAAVLPAVTVTAQLEAGSTAALQQEGRADQGYRASSVSSLGVLGGSSLQDAPFSISVVPAELIQNLQAQSPDDVYKLNPSTRTITPQITGWTPMVSIRGFDGSNIAEDGLRRAYNHAAVIEDKERVEVLNGLSGFLFGAASPGGMINYVYKRPTMERLNSITVGDYGGSQWYAHGDFGGRIDDGGRAGYRVNLVKQDGGTVIDDQHVNRTLASVALDLQLSDELLLELTGVYNHYLTAGMSAYWYFNVPHVAAPDARRLWGQPWVRDEFSNNKLMARLTYRLGDQATLRAAYMRDNIDRPVQDHTMNSVDSAEGYEQIRIRSGRTKDKYDAISALADIAFRTGGAAHKLTFGAYTYADKSWSSTSNPNSGWQGRYPFNAPSYVPEPAFDIGIDRSFYSGRVKNTNYVLGDQVHLGERWSVLAGVNRSTIISESRDAGGLPAQPDYDRSRTSPSLSLVFKPAPWLTAYASHIEGLEQGGIAPDEVVNHGQIQAPMNSRQNEAGVKAGIGQLLLTAALFDIEKAYEYTNSANVYTQSGRQRHRGAEFNASGKLTPQWTVIGGVTALRARVLESELDGKTPVNVARTVAKLYSEYELPLAGLTLTGGVYYTGTQWADELNTDRLPAFTTADAGVRYATALAGKPLTLRLNVANLTGKNYWLNAYYVGAPRSVAASAQLQF